MLGLKLSYVIKGAHITKAVILEVFTNNDPKDDKYLLLVYKLSCRKCESKLGLAQGSSDGSLFNRFYLGDDGHDRLQDCV